MSQTAPTASVIPSAPIVSNAPIVQTAKPGIAIQTTSESTHTVETTSKQTSTTALQGVDANPPDEPIQTALEQGGAIAAVLFVVFLGMGWMFIRMEQILKTVLTTKR